MYAGNEDPSVLSWEIWSSGYVVTKHLLNGILFIKEYI